MKIQTQFHLLIAGIIIVPVLLIIAQAVYQHNSTVQERQEIAHYEDIIDMFNDEGDFENREFLSRFLFRLSKLGKIAVFRKDLLVLHSEIEAFIDGTYAATEEIFAFLALQDSRHSFSFESPGILKNHGYIMIQRDLPPDRRSVFFGGFLYPVFIAIILFFFLIIFAITMSLFIARSITKSVMVLENDTRRIAAGELDLAVEARGSNEITSLTNSLNTMRNALKEEERRRYRFIMGVTHDLKTPLAIIKAYTEAIEDGIVYPEGNGSATEIINSKVDHLEGMIDDLIDFVRMDTGEWRSQLKNIDLSAFLQNSARAFALDAGLLNHELRFNSSLPDGTTIPMDERLVQRALENIVTNAIRYTPARAVITIDALAAQKFYLLTISDNGPGIDSEDLPHIFEMFYRGSSSRREQGMGLGLAVAKWVADCHGWTISAVSGKGAGAYFTIVIPA